MAYEYNSRKRLKAIKYIEIYIFFSPSTYYFHHKRGTQSFARERKSLACKNKRLTSINKTLANKNVSLVNKTESLVSKK